MLQLAVTAGATDFTPTRFAKPAEHISNLGHTQTVRISRYRAVTSPLFERSSWTRRDPTQRDTQAVTTHPETPRMKSSVTIAADRIVVEHLELHDPQLAAFVAERDPGEQPALVERALRIGLMTICNAGVSLTTDVVRTEFTRLSERLETTNARAAEALGGRPPHLPGPHPRDWHRVLSAAGQPHQEGRRSQELITTIGWGPVVTIKVGPNGVVIPTVPGELRLLIGDLVAGQNVELVLSVRFPQAEAGLATSAFFTIGDRDGALKADGCTLAWQHAEAADVDAQPRDREVDRAVARIYAARARLEAVHLNRLGEYRDARHALSGVARRIAGYVGSDTELKALAAQLIAEEAAFSAPMAELDRKSAHFRSANIQRSRDPGGHQRR